MKIKLIKSSFYNEEYTKNKLCDFIRNADILSMNKECKKFEEKFSNFQGRKYSVFVTSGSSANLLLIQSLINIGKLKIGDKVGVSALTWSTNIMPIIQLGLKPVLIDCEIDTINVSLRKIKEVEIDALFLTNALGFSSDIDEIKKYCNDKKILFFEDNCESFGSEYKGRSLGNFGIASTFSFYVGHHISTIEGGMVCTDDKELYDSLLISRIHGWARDLPKQNRDELKNKYNVDDFYNKYTFYDLAYNVRPNEINGFIGNIQIDYANEIISKRELNFRKINDVITNNPDLINLNIDNMTRISNFGVPLIFKTKDLFAKYRERFESNGIEIRPIISGNMGSQPFFKKYFTSPENIKNAEFIHENGFYCGNNPELTNDELNFICSLIDKNYNKNSEYIPNEFYSKIVEAIPIPTVDIIIFNNDLSKTLLFKRNNVPAKNEYYSMGGRINKGESLVDCAIRKLHQEISLNVDKSRLIQCGTISENFDEDSKVYSFLNIYFSLVVSDDADIKLDSQHSQHKWFDINDESINHYVKEKIKNCLIKNGKG